MLAEMRDPASPAWLAFVLLPAVARVGAKLRDVIAKDDRVTSWDDLLNEVLVKVAKWIERLPDPPDPRSIPEARRSTKKSWPSNKKGWPSSLWHLLNTFYGQVDKLYWRKRNRTWSCACLHVRGDHHPTGEPGRRRCHCGCVDLQSLVVPLAPSQPRRRPRGSRPGARADPVPRQVLARERLREIFGKWPGRQRTALKLADEGYKDREVADRLNVKVGTVSSWKSRWRKALKSEGIVSPPQASHARTRLETLGRR